MEKHRMRYGNNKQRNASARVDAAPKGTDCFGSRFAFGNIIALTDDDVIVRAICASALPKKSRTFWETY